MKILHETFSTEGISSNQQCAKAVGVYNRGGVWERVVWRAAEGYWASLAVRAGPYKQTVARSVFYCTNMITDYQLS
jgi:hypothetical protein